ncbi:MAG TPA: hypothetical protein HA326_07870, partial [Thermoplasmata archaeon]|nr:hypothetical protein [Thermoplasmata archaeon]
MRSSSSSTTPEPSSGPSSRSDGAETCDRLTTHVRPLFAYKIGGKTVTPDLVTRHQVLDGDRTGCRWEDEGSTLSLIAGPGPIKRPWVVLDRAWDDPT